MLEVQHTLSTCRNQRGYDWIDCNYPSTPARFQLTLLQSAVQYLFHSCCKKHDIIKAVLFLHKCRKATYESGAKGLQFHCWCFFIELIIHGHSCVTWLLSWWAFKKININSFCEVTAFWSFMLFFCQTSNMMMCTMYLFLIKITWYRISKQRLIQRFSSYKLACSYTLIPKKSETPV